MNALSFIEWMQENTFNAIFIILCFFVLTFGLKLLLFSHLRIDRADD